MYRAVTRDMEVTVTPRYPVGALVAVKQLFFLGLHHQHHQPGSETVQLKTRHWLITDASGKEQEVKGPGVVGEEPMLKPGD